MYEFLLEMTQVMQSFGCSRAEAVARINDAWGDLKPDDEYHYDLYFHEEPEFWAHILYYEGDVPYWEENVDRSTWKVKPAPPRDSACWTVKDDAT